MAINHFFSYKGLVIIKEVLSGIFSEHTSITATYCDRHHFLRALPGLSIVASEMCCGRTPGSAILHQGHKQIVALEFPHLLPVLVSFIFQIQEQTHRCISDSYMQLQRSVEVLINCL